MVKIDTLEKLAELLQVSLPTLLGVASIYCFRPPTYFERHAPDRRKRGAQSSCWRAAFYLLASDVFNAVWGQLLKESLPRNVDDAPSPGRAEVEEIMAVLHPAKENNTGPATPASVCRASEISRFLINGMWDASIFPTNCGVNAAPSPARKVEHFARIMEEGPIRRADRGSCRETLPHTGFQNFPPAGPPIAVAEPFSGRRGNRNVRVGVAMITSVPSAGPASPRRGRHVAAGAPRRCRRDYLRGPDCTPPGVDQKR